VGSRRYLIINLGSLPSPKRGIFDVSGPKYLKKRLFLLTGGFF
jgi:hypothetical protein